MFRIAFAAALLVGTAVQANGFRYYPGFTDFDTPIEMVHDRGLTLEIVVRCDVKIDGSISPGIMSYSKVERQFCTPRGCTRDAERAIDKTCGG